MELVEIVEGDTMTRIIVQFIDHGTGLPIVATGGTAKLTWSLNGAANVQKSMSSLDVSIGKFYYRPTSTDFTAGLANAQAELTDATSKIGTAIDEFKILVSPKRSVST